MKQNPPDVKKKKKKKKKKKENTNTYQVICKKILRKLTFNVRNVHTDVIIFVQL